MKTNDNNICLELGNIIKSSLIPLIPGDYILLDLPYYSNIGDILIWKGTEDFLKELPLEDTARKHSISDRFLKTAPSF